MKNALATVWQNPIAEYLKQCLFDVAEEISIPDTNRHLDIQRNIKRRIDLQILAGHSITLDAIAQLLFENDVYVFSAQPVDRQEHRVPTACPSQGRSCALDIQPTISRNIRAG